MILCNFNDSFEWWLQIRLCDILLAYKLAQGVPQQFLNTFEKIENFHHIKFFHPKIKNSEISWKKRHFFKSVTFYGGSTATTNTFRALHFSRDNLHIYTSWRLSGISSITLICGDQDPHYLAAKVTIHIFQILLKYGFQRSVQVSNNNVRGQISTQMCSNKFLGHFLYKIFSFHVAVLVIFGRQHGSRAF